MKIIRVEFVKLFGFFNYSIDFHDTVTIIHGPNGCGKTTMLKIIDAVFNKEVEVIRRTDFESVKFCFTEGISLKVERKRVDIDLKGKIANGIVYLAYTVVVDNQEYVFDSLGNCEEYQAIIEKFLNSYRPLPFLEKISQEKWRDRRTGEILTTEEVIGKYSPRIIRHYGKELFDDELPEKVRELLALVDVRLISADRLTVEKNTEPQYGERRVKIERRVDIIANNLAIKIQEAIQKYAQLSQAKDRTFPLRAIKQNSLMTVEEIKKKMVDLETKRREFIDTGILEEGADEIDIHELVDAITENNRQNLSLYATDTEEKLNALADLSSSINLFRNLIDSSFDNKKIIFSKEYGFRFITAYSNSIVLPQNLSSGEQHELVMFYDLIFNTSEKTLILIDEPELSLHIKWQLSYVNELLDIIKIAGFSAVLATHSPQIIHDKWNLTISLSE